MKKIKHVSLKSLRKKAWEIQSRYIRQEEKGVCFTCGNERPWKEQQCGHYIHKDCLDFERINLHCQCVRCNKWLSGNSGVYAEKMIKKYGLEAVLELRKKSQIIRKFKVFELEELIELYNSKLKDIE